MSADRISSTGKITMDGESFETNAASGNSSTRIFTGSKQLLMQQRSVELFQGATTTKLEATGDGNYKLTCGYNFDISLGSSGADKPVSVHELENEMSEADIFTSDTIAYQLYNSFGGVAGAKGALTFLRSRVNEWDASEQQDADKTRIQAKFTSTYAGAQQTLMLNLFNGIAYNGFRTTREFHPVYRRRITAASFNQIQAAFTGAGQIWTTSEVVNFEGVPNAWWFTLPTNVTWLKVPPTINTVAGQKTELCYYYMSQFMFPSISYSAYGAATLL